MSNVLHTGIEIGTLYLEIELEYDFIPGEDMVRYYSDGSGHPGSSPSAEMVSATVTQCDIGTKGQMRDDTWIWKALDIIAEDLINRDWDRFEEQCIEDASGERDYDE